jgi:hypothetical protein
MVDNHRTQLILGLVGLGLVAVAFMISLAPVSGFRAAMILPAIIGAILIHRTEILRRLQSQDAARRSISSKTPAHRRILSFSRFVLVVSMLGCAVFGCAHWMDGIFGLSALDWWLIGMSLAMVSMIVGAVLTIQEAAEIECPVGDQPGCDLDAGL